MTQRLKIFRPLRGDRFVHVVPWLMLVLGLGITLSGWAQQRQTLETNLNDRFNFEVNQVQDAIVHRLQLYEDVLHGVQGLFAASQSVDSGEWHKYVNALTLDSHYPGIMALGFVANEPDQAAAAFKPATPVAPVGADKEDAWLVQYLEPVDYYDLAPGYDIGAVTTLRAAAEYARDTGLASLSGKITLSQEMAEMAAHQHTVADDQGNSMVAEVLLILPVYRNDLPTPTTTLERQAALEGWVFALLDMNKMMLDLLDEELEGVHFEIYDGPAVSYENLLFNHAFGVHDPGLATHMETAVIEVAGKTWALQFGRLPAFNANVQHNQLNLILGGGFAASFLLFALAWSMTTTRQRAVTLAHDMNQELEKLIDERTIQVQEVNKQLQQEIEERTRMEEELRASERRYRSLFEGIPVGLYRTTPTGEVLDANPALVQMLGYPDLETYLKLSVDADLYVDPQDRIRWQELIEKEGIVHDFETQARRRDGSIIWMRDTAQVIRDEDGQPLYYDGIWEDVTPRKLAEAELKRAKDFAETVLNSMSDAISIIDVNTFEIVGSNRVFREELGLTVEEIIGQTCYAVTHHRSTPCMPPEDPCPLLETCLTHRAASAEHVHFLANGEKRYVEISVAPIKNEQGDIVQVVHVARDITERKEAEKALAAYAADTESKNVELERRSVQLQAAAEVGHIVTSIRDLDQLLPLVTNLVNERFDFYHVAIFLMDKTGEQAILQAANKEGKAHPAVLGHKIRVGEKGMVGRVLQTKEPRIALDVTKDATFNPFALLPDTRSEITLPLIANGRLLGVLDVQSKETAALTEEDIVVLQVLANQVVGAIENARIFQAIQEHTAELALANTSLKKQIRERQRAEKALKSYAVKLERNNRELEDLTYIASHDLQEPLRKLRTFGSRLQTRYSRELGNKGGDYVIRMQNAAAQMQALLNDLIMYLSITTKARPFAPVNLNQIMQVVLADLSFDLEERDGQVAVDDLPTIEADPLQIQQMLQQLLSNALKFSHPDKPPVVTVQGHYLAEEEKPQMEDGQVTGWYQLAVTDNGIGFDEKYQERIFTVFERLHGQEMYTGTGMGLSICRKIVERHGGIITAQSKPGKGTSIIITLPTAQPEHEKEKSLA